MVNLSCIHIPGEVFQSSEGYLEPSRTSGVTADGFFLQKSSIADVRLGSKYASGIVLLYSICVIRILAWPLKCSSEGMLFLANIWAEEQRLYKNELLYLYLLKIYKNYLNLPFIVKIQNGAGRGSISGGHLQMAASNIVLLKLWSKTVCIMIIFVEKWYCNQISETLSL